MDPIILTSLLIKLGTEGIPLILKLKADIDAGRKQTSVSEADLLELHRMAQQTAADILSRGGVVPPPPANRP